MVERNFDGLVNSDIDSVESREGRTWIVDSEGTISIKVSRDSELRDYLSIRCDNCSSRETFGMPQSSCTVKLAAVFVEVKTIPTRLPALMKVPLSG